MSETKNAVTPTKENNLKADKSATNAVASKMEAKDSTPATGRGRRKRTSEMTDSSLVISTPGADSNRRTTRSQTRGTPAPPPPPAPTPAKKPALEKPNGSAAKGRRGRPPKGSATEEKPAEASPVIPEESATEEKMETEDEEDEPTPKAPETPKETPEPVKEKEPETKVEPSKEEAPKPEDKVEEKKEDAPSSETVVDGASESKEAPKEDEKKEEKAPEPEVQATPEVNKAEEEPETKPAEEKEEPVETKENSQPEEPIPEPTKETPVVEKPAIIAETGDSKPVEAESKIVNNATSDTVNNHEQA